MKGFIICLVILITSANIVYSANNERLQKEVESEPLESNKNISVIVFLDKDGDGVFGQEDKGYEGIPITLISPVISSDKDGKVCFSMIDHGKYMVMVDLNEVPVDLLCPINLNQTVEIGTQSVILAFPLQRAASIEGRIFVDKNKNGIYEQGEMGLSERIIYANEQVMISDDDGIYRFGNILPERYKVSLSKDSIPEGFEAITPLSLEIELKQGEKKTGIDFGIARKQKPVEFIE